MVKTGKAFSIFVVFTLLILIAPAVVLTGGGVALGTGEAVTEEIEASFSLTEDVPGGNWHSCAFYFHKAKATSGHRLTPFPYGTEIWYIKAIIQCRP